MIRGTPTADHGQMGHDVSNFLRVLDMSNPTCTRFRHVRCEMSISGSEMDALDAMEEE
jgi:hypothetical protein